MTDPKKENYYKPTTDLDCSRSWDRRKESSMRSPMDLTTTEVLGECSPLYWDTASLSRMAAQTVPYWQTGMEPLSAAR
jgi:hypothetical protein